MESKKCIASNYINKQDNSDKIKSIYQNNENIFLNYNNYNRIKINEDNIDKIKNDYGILIDNIGNSVSTSSDDKNIIDSKQISNQDIKELNKIYEEAVKNNDGTDQKKEAENTASVNLQKAIHEKNNYDKIKSAKKEFITNMYNRFSNIAGSGSGSLNIRDMKRREELMVGTITDLLDEHTRQCMNPTGKKCPPTDCSKCGYPDVTTKCKFSLFNKKYTEKKDMYYKAAMAASIMFIIAFILVKSANMLDNYAYPEYIHVFYRAPGPAPNTFATLNDNNGIFNITDLKNQNYQLNSLLPFINNKYLLKSPLNNNIFGKKFCNLGVFFYVIFVAIYAGFMTNDINNDVPDGTPANVERNETNAQVGIKWTMTIIISLVVFVGCYRVLFGNLGLPADFNAESILKIVGCIVISAIAGSVTYGIIQAYNKTKRETQCGYSGLVLGLTYAILSILYIILLRLPNYGANINGTLSVIRNLFLICLFAANHGFNGVLIRYFPSLWVSYMVIQKIILALISNLGKFNNWTDIVGRPRLSTLRKITRSMGIDNQDTGKFMFLLDPLFYGVANGFGIFLGTDNDQPWREESRNNLFEDPAGPGGLAGVNIPLNENHAVADIIADAARIDLIQPIPEELIGTNFLL